MNAKFFDEATRVVNSPYFSAWDKAGDGDQMFRELQRLQAEKHTLQDVFPDCNDYNDLHGKAKAIYDRAKATLGG